MRKMYTKKVTEFRCLLTCVACGKQATMHLGIKPDRRTEYGAHTLKDAKFQIPTMEWNGWNLEKTELCPSCNTAHQMKKLSTECYLQGHECDRTPAKLCCYCNRLVCESCSTDSTVFKKKRACRNCFFENELHKK